VFIQQILLSLDPRYATIQSSTGFSTSAELQHQVASVDLALKQRFGIAENQLHFDPDLCYKPSPDSPCFSMSPSNTTEASHRKIVLTYAFDGEAIETAREWTGRLQDSASLQELSKSIETSTGRSLQLRSASSIMQSVDNLDQRTSNDESPVNDSVSHGRAPSGLGLSLPLSPRTATTSYKERNLREMRGAQWFIYAFKAFVMRFWTLTKVRLNDRRQNVLR